MSKFGPEWKRKWVKTRMGPKKEEDPRDGVLPLEVGRTTISVFRPSVRRRDGDVVQ